MKLKNLLIIANNFPDKENKYIGDIFVKEQLKYLRNYFEHIYVIIPIAYGMDYLRKTNYENYQFDNVKVFFPKYFNIPFLYFVERALWVELEKRAVLRLIKLEDLKFDLIHAHFTWPSGAVAVELKKRFNVPVVITEHTHITLYKELKRRNKYYIGTWKLCDAVIRVNRRDVHLFIEAGISPDKVFYIANGYSPSKFKAVSVNEAREKLGLEITKKIILNISRLYDEKGQRYLIQSINGILSHNRDVMVYIGGSGPLKDKLELQIKNLKLQDNVKLIGFIPDKLMPIWMSACDLFILPSLSESFGIVQVEAFACGKPVVATRNGASEEIINSEDYGMLVDPGDSESLARAIMLALDKEWDPSKIFSYAERFSLENISREIINVYMLVLEREPLNIQKILSAA
jgi:teichuronic acid biosynthesis glycosyltransferase TuaC